jgi:GT2 family glycosyltransferase
MKQSKIAVIIINWNGKHLLKECLISVRNQDYSNYKTILVDNGSSDGSVQFVKEKTILIIGSNLQGKGIITLFKAFGSFE